MKNFFISYNKADKEWAQWLDWQLRSRGYTTFTQFGDIPWGANFVKRMDEGLKEAERLILLLSPDSISSSFVGSEWTTMFTEDPLGNQSRLLGIRVRECEIKGLLSPLVRLDLWDQDEPGAAGILDQGLAALKISVDASNTVGDEPAPPFPYLRYDFIMEFCDLDAPRVQGIASQLESQQKTVWRDVWETSGGTPARKKNPPASLRFSCRVVCAGDDTPNQWTEREIEDALRRQRQQRDLKVMPLVFGSGLEQLRQKFADEIFFWADASNAVGHLLDAVNGTSIAAKEGQRRAEERLPRIEDPHKEYLRILHEIEPLLHPDIVIGEQRRVIQELRRDIYGGR